MLRYFVHLIFLTYTLMLFARILGSWFPNFARSRAMLFVCHYTDPYLNVFRRIIPPIGGTLDLSPILAFFALRLAEGFLMRIL